MPELLQDMHQAAANETAHGDASLPNPKACFQAHRVRKASATELAMGLTQNFCRITKEAIGAFPEILPVLRMACTPPMSTADLAASAQLNPTWLDALESDRLSHDDIVSQLVGLDRAAQSLADAMDHVAFPWLESGRSISSRELLVATFFVADRMCCADHAKAKQT